MKNTLGDLNLHLFAQLERLGDEEIKGDALTEEIERARAVAGISKQIIQNANIVLKAKQMQIEYCREDKDMPKMLEG